MVMMKIRMLYFFIATALTLPFGYVYAGNPIISTVPTGPTAGLYLSYPFSGNANDVSGNNNNGTVQNGASLTADRYNNASSAYSFNGSSQYISTTTSVASPGPQNFSISVWFETTTTTGGKLVGFGSSQTGGSGSDDRHIYMSNTGQIYFGLYPGSCKAINTTTTYADGKWHHAVATESTTNGANLYVDGALQATDASMTTSQSYTGYWRVGYDNLWTWPGQPTSFYFKGSLDDIAVYNTELTAAQVYTLYGGGSAPVCAGSTLSLQVNSVSGATYSWSGPNSFSSTSQNPTVSSSATTAMAGTYTCTVTTAGGSSSIKVTAVVNAEPTLGTMPTSGAYLSYPFTAGSLTDISGSSNTATISGTVTSTTDRFGNASNAYNFDGSTGSIYTTNSIASPGPQNFSISVWFKTTTGGGLLVGFGSSRTGSSGNHDRCLYMNNSGKIYYGIWPGVVKTINTATAYNDGNWHHAVATTSTTNGSNLYIDGVLQATDATMTTSQSYTGYWRIGYDSVNGWTSQPTNFYFTGSLDDIAVYNTALTAAQVGAAYGAWYTGSTSCGNTLSLNANTVSGATYAWTGPTGASIPAGQNPSVSNAPAGTYTCTVTNGCTSSISLIVGTSYTWTGTTDTNPITAANWGGTAPPFNGTDNLVIPAGLTNYPALTASESISTLTIGTLASFSLNGFTLSVGCNIYNSATGQILYGSSNSSGVTFNGTAAQTYTGGSTTNTAELGNMTINNTAGVTITGGPVDIYNLLTITSGNLIINNAGNGVLTLKSTATQTAAVGVMPSGYSIQGEVNAERFLTGGGLSSNRGYRLLSSPVNQSGYATSASNTFGLYYLGIHNSYAGALTIGIGGTSNGFGITNNNPTIYLYDESQVYNGYSFTLGNHVPVYKINSTETETIGTYTNKSIPIGNGFLMYFVGPSSRTDAWASTPPQDVTLTGIGYVNQGDFTVNLWTTGGSTLSYTAGSPVNTTTHPYPGLTMVGNPYPSTIDLHQVISDNTSSIDNVYVLSAKDSPNQTYIAYTAFGTSAPNQGYAVSGEGFFVHVTSSGAKTLTFNESEKVPSVQLTGSGLIMAAPNAHAQALGGGLPAGQHSLAAALPQNVLSGLYMKIEKDSTTYDYCGIYFRQDWSAKLEDGDAPDLNSTAGAVVVSSLSSDNIRLAVNHMPDYAKGIQVKLYANARADGLYNLKIEGIRNIDTLYDIYLIDHYKKDSLDIRRYGSYAFNIYKSDTSSFGGNRFELSVRLRPLPVYHLLDFAGQKVNSGIQVSWKTEAEGNYTGFVLQKQDGASGQYNQIDSGQGNGSGTYNYVDTNPVTGNNTYRLQQSDVVGNISYSPQINIVYNPLQANGAISVYPNPTKSALNLKINPALNLAANTANNAGTVYGIKIVSTLGSVILSATTNQQNWQTDVNGLLPGTYIVQVVNNRNGSFVGKGTFVKL
jgi:hypothetical protein